MPILTIDLDNLEEIDALYLIDKLSEELGDPDLITASLRLVAIDIADGMDPRAREQDVLDAADAIFPQTQTMWTAEERHRHVAKRNEHLRRFGFLKEIGE